MSCARSNSNASNTCRTVAKVNGSSGSGMKRPNVECALKDANLDKRLDTLFRKAVRKYRESKTVNIDYANEYLTRGRESDLGTLSFFIVDDLLDTLNLDATRTVFTNESGFKLKKVKNADTIRLMYQLAENVKLLDTVAEKTLDWFQRQQDRIMCSCGSMDEHVWTIWDMMNLSEYIRMYKEIYECMPGDESRTFYESTSLHSILHHCNPDRTAQVIEYTVSNSEPKPICASNSGGGACNKSNASRMISSSCGRRATSAVAKKRNQSACARKSR